MRKFKKNLEENGKLNSISSTLKIEMIAHFTIWVEKVFFSTENNEEKLFFFRFPG